MEALIGIVHVAWTVFISIYAFIISKARGYDFYYIGYVLLLVVSWLAFKDECLITYAYKKYKNPDYVMGQDSNKLKDSEDIFGEELSRSVINIIITLTIISIYCVSKRSHFAPNYVWSLFVLFLALYLLIQRKFYAPRFYDAHLKKYNPAFRIMFLAITGLYLWFLLIGGNARN